MKNCKTEGRSLYVCTYVHEAVGCGEKYFKIIVNNPRSEGGQRMWRRHAYILEFLSTDKRLANVCYTVGPRVLQGRATLQTIPWDRMFRIVDRN